MKTITTLLIAMILTVTASAETWKQKVERLEREVKYLKAKVARLEKENHELGGNAQVPEKKAEKKAPTRTDIMIKQLEREKKALMSEYRLKYQFKTRANKDKRQTVIDKIKELSRNIRNLKKQKELNKARKVSKSSVLTF